MYQCKECGARLDPCEKCDCLIQKQIETNIKTQIKDWKSYTANKGVAYEN